MSPTRPDTGPPDRHDLLAAEYVLGVLDLEDRLAAEALIRRSPRFAALVEAWETRLAPLADEIAPVRPPDLMPEIERRLFGAGAPRRGTGLLRVWQAVAGAALAGLVALAVLYMDRAPVDAPRALAVATLAGAETPLRFVAVYDTGTGALKVRRTAGPPAAEGRDYQLWAIGADDVPRSLGLMDAEEIARPATGVGPGVTLAVSLEPAGGSPAPTPTGPVLATGRAEEF